MSSSISWPLAAAACTALLLALERLAMARARGRLRLVVHVNGTRGKSTLTRMTHALLVESGYRAYAKTTGTEPRLIAPDGSERLIRRLGPANVREQRNFMVLAALRGADAVVFECNAVQPELQKVSSLYLDADLLVLTNARLDHRLEQGDAEDAARAFADCIPPGGAVATADPAFREAWAAAAAARGAGLFYRPPSDGDGLDPIPENAACLLAAADAIGASSEAAIAALRSYSPDPGAFRIVGWNGGRAVWFADALAANDPASTRALAAQALRLAASSGRGRWKAALVVVNRRDRPDRCLQFAEYAADACGPGGAFEEALFIGPLPRYARAVLDAASIRYARMPGPRRGGRRFVEALDEALGTASGTGREGGRGDGRPLLVVAAGNRVGTGAALRAWADARATEAVSLRIGTEDHSGT